MHRQAAVILKREKFQMKFREILAVDTIIGAGLNLTLDNGKPKINFRKFGRRSSITVVVIRQYDNQRSKDAVIIYLRVF